MEIKVVEQIKPVARRKRKAPLMCALVSKDKPVKRKLVWQKESGYSSGGSWVKAPKETKPRKKRQRKPKKIKVALSCLGRTPIIPEHLQRPNKIKDFFYQNINISVTITNNSVTLNISGDVKDKLAFKSATPINPDLALLVAHICAVPFQIQTKNFSIDQKLVNPRLRKVVTCYRANLSQHLSLNRNYQYSFNNYKLKRRDFRDILSIVKNTACPSEIPPMVSMALSSGKSSLLTAHFLQNTTTRYFSYNRVKSKLTTDILYCPRKLTYNFAFAPSEYRHFFRTMLPARIFTLAATSTELLFFGDTFEANQAFTVPKEEALINKKGKIRRPGFRDCFFSTTFGQSAYMNGLLNWAVEGITKTRITSLLSNLCELQVQGILDSLHGQHNQVSCDITATGCAYRTMLCPSCRKASLIFEALGSRKREGSRLSLPVVKHFENLSVEDIWHLFKASPECSRAFKDSPAYKIAKRSTNLLKNIIRKKRGLPYNADTSIEWIASRIHTKFVPFFPTPFDTWIDQELLYFKNKLEKLRAPL